MWSAWLSGERRDIYCHRGGLPAMPTLRPVQAIRRAPAMRVVRSRRPSAKRLGIGAHHPPRRRWGGNVTHLNEGEVGTAKAKAEVRRGRVGEKRPHLVAERIDGIWSFDRQAHEVREVVHDRDADLYAQRWRDPKPAGPHGRRRARIATRRYTAQRATGRPIHCQADIPGKKRRRSVAASFAPRPSPAHARGGAIPNLALSSIIVAIALLPFGDRGRTNRSLWCIQRSPVV
jgi:hypothetical protein